MRCPPCSPACPDWWWTSSVLVPEGDVAAYADALAALAGDPTTCRELGEAGAASVAHLDWDRIAAAQLAVYRAAAGAAA